MLDVCGTHAMAGERSYVVVLPDGSKTLLPIWMTEPAAAGPIALTTAPTVSVAALETLRTLLAPVLAARHPRPEGDPCP